MEGRATPLELPELPAPVRAVVEALAEDGHRAVFVGGCVRSWLSGVPARDFDVATSAAPEAVLARFPAAIPIGLRHGTVMIPTPAGPVDVTRFRGGGGLAQDLAHRDFTLNAMAYDPRRGELLDPFDGRADLAKGRLRAVGSARERFAEDPLRALRAARLASTLGLEVDADVERAMAGARTALEAVARERVRHELGALLVAPSARAGLALLQRTGLEAALAPGVAAGAAERVAALPCELEVRLAGWLLGANAGAILRRLRFSKRTVQRVERLIALHPVEAQATADAPGSVRRLVKRAGEANLRPLFALRRAELAAEPAGPAAASAAEDLERLERAVEQQLRSGALALRRFDLAIGGAEVMEHLGCGPGPTVGRALRFLTERVIEQPERNTPDGLRELLDRWRAPAPD